MQSFVINNISIILLLISTSVEEWVEENKKYQKIILAKTNT